jgi:hypothetical protein
MATPKARVAVPTVARIASQQTREAVKPLMVAIPVAVPVTTLKEAPPENSAALTVKKAVAKGYVNYFTDPITFKVK